MAQDNENDPVAALLEEAAETHHRVYRITEGVDDDWASWYADWLLSLSELPQLLGARPVRSHLVHALVQLDRDHAAVNSDEPWPVFYARHLPQHLVDATLGCLRIGRLMPSRSASVRVPEDGEGTPVGVPSHEHAARLASS